MANKRDLKKDINYVLGDIIELVYNVNTAKSEAIIDEAIEPFDEWRAKVTNKNVVKISLFILQKVTQDSRLF